MSFVKASRCPLFKTGNCPRQSPCYLANCCPLAGAGCGPRAEGGTRGPGGLSYSGPPPLPSPGALHWSLSYSPWGSLEWLQWGPVWWCSWITSPPFQAPSEKKCFSCCALWLWRIWYFLTCMAITDRGISSLWFLIAKCQDRIRIRSSKLNSTISRPSVYTLNNFTNEYTFGLITGNRCHLCEHGLAMLGHHGGLVTVERNNILMKRFFRVSQLPVQIRHTALEYTPEKPGDQCPPNSWNGMKWGSEGRGW